MAYSVRHQVFVSSTFTDLVEERAEVIQAVWELDCIPTGMEAFVASNDSQWDVIQRVIEECDYYVLIIGGRYGSITEDGVSYTEKEYRFAKKLGIPVLAFVHASPEQIPVGKSEKDSSSRAQLDAFRTEVMSQHPVRSWSTASELGGLVSRSLVREIKVSPRPGWIRNDGSSPVALLEQITKLTEENGKLRELIDAAQIVADNADDSALEQGSDNIELRGTWRLKSPSGSTVTRGWSASASWDDIFRDLGPALINETTETELKDLLVRFRGWATVPQGYVELSTGARLAVETWNEVLVQLRALGLVDKGIRKRGVNDRGSYWRITPKGDRYLVGLMARKRAEKA